MCQYMFFQNSCINKCCNPTTCQLVEGAACANGECCDLNTCQILPATTVCRQATNECDLPEYCDGQMEHCPADFFVQDGHECPNHIDVNSFIFFELIYILGQKNYMTKISC